MLAITFGLCTLGAAMAQTPGQSPVPTPESVPQAPAWPPYDVPAQKPTAPLPQAPGQQAPIPQTAPPPAIVPAAPNPYVAWPPYQARGPYVPYGIPDEDRPKNHNGSVYIPVDNWIYPEMTRLYSLGYVPTMFLSMRPWTRQSVLNMLEISRAEITDGNSDEAKEIFAVVEHELDSENFGGERGTVYGTESVYVRAMGISGTTLRDSYHLGQTIVNDYGRPYQAGFNSLLGFSTLAERGRFSLYVRGEYQHSPGGAGYTQALSSLLSNDDAIAYSGYNVNQATIPAGPIGAQNPLRLMEATLSYHILGHEISGGKSDAWLGPAQGGALAWSNNAENIYSFRINRVEPLHIPLLSRVIGPMRYDAFYGSLKGHTAPNSPYVHAEMFSFRPTNNFEFAFQRTVIFGGKGHEPVTLHTFLRSVFSLTDTTGAEKNSPQDPGARFSDFSFSWRLPFLRKYVTLIADSIAHDDVTPPSAPRRAAYRTGLYLSQVPRLPKLDLRVEAVNTNPHVGRSYQGTFNYFEIIQLQGYTNKGFIMGDWIGREANGTQAWATYHLSGNEWVQVEYLNKKTPEDFIPGGTTQNSFKVDVVKRLGRETQIDAWYQYERWKAPVYLPGGRNDSVGAVQVTFYPKLQSRGAR